LPASSNDEKNEIKTQHIPTSHALREKILGTGRGKGESGKGRWEKGQGGGKKTDGEKEKILSV
jgi:hypothetical protein